MYLDRQRILDAEHNLIRELMDSKLDNDIAMARINGASLMTQALLHVLEEKNES